tara:strand:+ start:2134 stop:2418 length:285 start_codon:yes stop_codon:yes gene_type:complete
MSRDSFRHAYPLTPVVLPNGDVQVSVDPDVRGMTVREAYARAALPTCLQIAHAVQQGRAAGEQDALELVSHAATMARLASEALSLELQKPPGSM